MRNVTIKNSYFYDGGSSADIFITDQNQGLLSQNILIQNNVFGRSLNIPIDVSNVEDLKISYNTFPFGGPGWIAAGRNVSIVGNLASHNLCPAPPGVATYSHNVWFLDDPTGGSADRCGQSDVALKSNGDNIFMRMASPRGDFVFAPAHRPSPEVTPTTSRRVIAQAPAGRKENCPMRARSSAACRN